MLWNNNANYDFLLFSKSREHVSLNFRFPVLFGNSMVLENCYKETHERKGNARVNAKQHSAEDFLSKKE